MPSSLRQELQKAHENLQRVASFLSPQVHQEITQRVARWQHLAPSVQKLKSNSFPPLVMRPGSSPRPLNPLYFKLKS